MKNKEVNFIFTYFLRSNKPENKTYFIKPRTNIESLKYESKLSLLSKQSKHNALRFQFSKFDKLQVRSFWNTSIQIHFLLTLETSS